MKRLEIFLLASFVGIGLLAIGCGGSGDTKGTTPQDQPAASAPAEASKPATEQAAPPSPPRLSPPTKAPPRASGLLGGGGHQGLRRYAASREFRFSHPKQRSKATR